MEHLTKEKVLSELAKYDLVGVGRIMFKVLDYSDNPLSPNKVAYRIHYSDMTGQRRKVTYYPGTVGFQWG